MLRVVCIVGLLGGCHLYMGGEDDDVVEPGPDPGPVDRYTIERECIHNLVGGNLLPTDDDEFFMTWRCEGAGVVTHVIERAGMAVVENENANYQDQFGKLRLAHIDNTPTVISMFEHSPQIWLFSAHGGQRVSFERAYDDMVIGDLDGDGKRDFVLAGDNAIRRAPATSDVYGFPLTVRASEEKELLTGKPFASVVRAQLDDAGLPDLFFVTRAGEVGIALQTAPDVFQVQPTFTDPGTPQQLIVADVDGDHRDDVIGVAGHLFVRSSKTGTIAFLTEPVQAFAVGDLDGDGVAEPVYITADKASVRRVSVGTIGLTTTHVAAGGGDALAVGDLDGDGLGDLAIVRDLNKPSSKLVIRLAPTF